MGVREMQDVEKERLEPSEPELATLFFELVQDLDEKKIDGVDKSILERCLQLIQAEGVGQIVQQGEREPNGWSKLQSEAAGVAIFALQSSLFGGLQCVQGRQLTSTHFFELWYEEGSKRLSVTNSFTGEMEVWKIEEGDLVCKQRSELPKGNWSL